MNIGKRLLVLISLLLIASSFQGGAAEEKYAIKLEYAAKVGEKYRLKAKGSERQEKLIITDGRTNSESKVISIELDGGIEVLEVDSQGHEKKIACTVQKCVAENNLEKKSLFKKGDVFVVYEEKGRVAFSQKGVDVSLATAEILPIVISIHTATVDDDDIFGTKEPKKVGDSWRINLSAALSSLNSNKAPITATGLEGSCQLTGIKKLNGKPYLDISANMKAEAEFPSTPGVTVREAGMEASFWGLFPADNSRRPAKESMSMKSLMKMEREAPSGLMSTARISFERAVLKDFGD